MGACLATLSPLALAQSATGAVAGRASAGDQITVTNPDTGLSRSVTADADGTYRLSQLPVGDYTVSVVRNGQPVGQPLEVNVALGGTTTLNIGNEGNVLNTVTVVGSRIVNRVDVTSTESATNITREELARMPVDQNLTSVALLAPGVQASPVFGRELSFGGSSIAENAVYINGLNVTDVYNRRGFSSTPFAFFEEFQVKTGGYSVEFGRSTGGVINAVTRSGTNEFHGGVDLTFEPAAWRESPEDHYHHDGTVHSRGSEDDSSFAKANVWASGPIVKDRLFFFGMYEHRDSESWFTNSDGDEWSESEASNGFWGAKLDWNLTDNHLLELMAFSDEADSITSNYGYTWDTRTVGGFVGIGAGQSGGRNWSLTYTGHLTDSFTAKAMYGVVERSSHTFAPSGFDDTCSDIATSDSYASFEAALPDLPFGCHPTGNRVDKIDDEREAARLDFEWALGDHLLRFGLDREVMKTTQALREPGPFGMTFTAIGVDEGEELDNGYFVEAGIDQMIVGRRYAKGGSFETEANAYYIEDAWNVTPNLLLTLGVRVDNFTNRAKDGQAFIDADNLFAPRLGFSWDMKGDGSTKLFGNLGRYYLPVSNNINVNFTAGLTDEETYYVLDGWTTEINPVTGAPYLSPIIGDQKGPVDTSGNVVVNDLRQGVDRDIDAVYQDEAILGYQAMINEAWSWGVNGTYRRMTSAIEDIGIRHTPCGPVVDADGDRFTQYVIGNPGEPMTIWGDENIGCATEGWITIDTSVDGWDKTNGEIVGYDKPKRTYKSVEFQIDRAWDDKWSFNASYLWSRSDGNFEGPVNSDLRYADTGMVQYFDHPAGTQRYGELFNSHRHQIKLRGSYALNDMFTVGGTLQAMSGGPITAYGVTWPGDSRGAGSFSSEFGGGGSGWICVQNCSGPVDGRVHEWTERGAFGRLPWTWTLGANITWTLPVEDVDLKAKFSVYNLTNNQRHTNVHSRYESSPGVYRPYFGQPIDWQSPRYMQLVVSYSF